MCSLSVPSSCWGIADGTSPATLAKLKEDQARFVKQLKQQNIKVVVTGWVSGGGSAAAPAPASAPVVSVSASAALGSYMQAHYKPTSMACDNYATQAEADARVAWLVNWAHTYKFDPVSVTFTYP